MSNTPNDKKAEEFEKKIKLKILAMRMNFVHDKLSLLNALSAEMTEDNIFKAQILGHQIKGSAATFNFQYMSEVGEKIENAASEKNIMELNNNLSELRSYLEAELKT